MRIFLADLGHNLLTKSSDVYPLGLANLATWLDAKIGPTTPLDIQLFREPQDLVRALDEGAPDMLGLSNYAWNEELAYHFAKYTKARSPKTLTFMGGPNWPLTEDVQDSFLRSLSAVDVYVDGPTYEGERAMEHLARRFIEGKGKLESVFEGAIPGCHFIDPSSAEFVRGEDVPRIRDLDEIPSPYLAGYMDPFYATGYFPMMQITRGCPFSCTFCNSGVRGNSKAFAHSIENIKADLLHIVDRVTPETTLCFADDNFGMYPSKTKRSPTTSATSRRPHRLAASTSARRPARTSTTGSSEGHRTRTGGALPMTAAVQSMNPEVLTNIKSRQHQARRLHQGAGEDAARHGHSVVRRAHPEPAGRDQSQTFMKGGRPISWTRACKRVSAHQLMLLLRRGPLCQPGQSVEKWGFETKLSRGRAQHRQVHRRKPGDRGR